jgi:hypothetical protein
VAVRLRGGLSSVAAVVTLHLTRRRRSLSWTSRRRSSPVPLAGVALDVQITFDCADADRLAAFWATALDYVVQPPPGDFPTWEAFLEANRLPIPERGSISAVVDPEGIRPRVLFLRVPEAKTVKNRVHLDVIAGDDEAKLAKVRRLVEAGGSEVRRVEESGQWWVVMHDPEGNEFCVV